MNLTWQLAYMKFSYEEQSGLGSQNVVMRTVRHYDSNFSGGFSYDLNNFVNL